MTAGSRTLLDHFDIFASGGANAALTRGFLVKVTGGQITLNFTGNAGNAAVAALSLAVIPPGGGGLLPSLLGQSDAVPDIPSRIGRVTRSPPMTPRMRTGPVPP